jgi:hypothetical protein
MYSMLKAVTVRRLLVSEAPGLVMSLAIAEFFYKFHSFTIEAVAFLVTWYVLSFIVNLVLRLLTARSPGEAR